MTRAMEVGAMKPVGFAGIVLAAMGLAVLPATAHHSFSAEYRFE